MQIIATRCILVLGHNDFCQFPARHIKWISHHQEVGHSHKANAHNKYDWRKKNENNEADNFEGLFIQKLIILSQFWIFG